MGVDVILDENLVLSHECRSTGMVYGYFGVVRLGEYTILHDSHSNEMDSQEPKHEAK